MSSNGESPRVLSVGQCGADHYHLAAFLRQHFQAEVAACDTAREALALVEAESFVLVLVNRVFDHDGGDGQALVRQLAGGKTPVMLVSNYAEAQAEAVQAGSLPGFGKAELNQPRTLDRLRAALGRGA